jgi:hypothetical protein
MSRDQKIRAILFYLSLAIFLIGLPLILSFAFGYKFNSRTFKFTKTGLIAIKTQPSGASVYFNGKLLNDKTPVSINELLPGKYDFRLELEKYYPWNGQVEVNEGKVSRLEKIILFPLRPNVKKINKDTASSFWVDEKKGKIYYLNYEDYIFYKSDMDGQNFERCAILPRAVFEPKKWKISPDRTKFLVFSPHQAAVIYLESANNLSSMEPPVILDFPDRYLTDIFWHSDSYHLVLVTTKNIEVLEAKQEAPSINLVNLNRKSNFCFYDENEDALFFIDAQHAPDGKLYDNVYKLELSAKNFSFQDLINKEQWKKITE